MTKRKPPDELRPRGRRKGSGEGLTVTLSTTATPTLASLVDKSARALSTNRAGVIRRILERWAARKLKRERRKFLALLQARLASRAGSDRKPVPPRER